MLHSQSSRNLRPESDHCCTMVLLFHESITAPRIVFTLCTPGCVRTHSIAIDLITSKVRYSLWFTAELFSAHCWRMHDTLTQQTKQFGRHKFTLRVRQVKSWDRDIQDPRTCATRYLPQTRDFKTSEFRRNCRATYGIVTRGPIHSNWKQYPFHLYKRNTTVFIACHNP